MTSYLLGRLAHSLVVLFLVSVVTFVLLHIAPGGPSVMINMGATAEDIEIARRNLGLDQPLHIQYIKWLSALLKGDFGRSFINGSPVMDLILERLPHTLLLSACALLLSLIVAIPVGIFSALRPNTWLDRVVTFFSLFGVSIPVFWFGIILILVFSVRLQWLPSSGVAEIGKGFSLIDRAKHLIMPSWVLATITMAELTRFTRSAMIDIVGQDYIRTARAKGLRERMVIYKHGMRNALIPVITVLGLSLPRLIGGTPIIEAIFGWPGTGRLAIDAAFRRDFPVTMGLTVVFAFAIILANLIIDVLYVYLDPRVRLQ